MIVGGAIIPLLQTLPDIEGRTITADAMHTQRALAEYLLGRGANYLFTVKGNQPTLLDDIRLTLMMAHKVKRRIWLDLVHDEPTFRVGPINGWFALRPGRNAVRINRACAHTQLLSGRFFGDGAPEPSLDPACCGRSVPEAGPIS